MILRVILYGFLGFDSRYLFLMQDDSVMVLGQQATFKNLNPLTL